MQLNPKRSAVTKTSENLPIFLQLTSHICYPKKLWWLKDQSNKVLCLLVLQLQTMSLISMNFIHSQQLWKKLQNTKWDTDIKILLILLLSKKKSQASRQTESWHKLPSTAAFVLSDTEWQQCRKRRMSWTSWTFSNTGHCCKLYSQLLLWVLCFYSVSWVTFV